MYPYHNRIKQRIANGELTGFELVSHYKDISPCLMLYFKTEPQTRPIRPHRFLEYQEILETNLQLTGLDLGAAAEQLISNPPHDAATVAAKSRAAPPK